jgi:hypothetical protein
MSSGRPKNLSGAWGFSLLGQEGARWSYEPFVIWILAFELDCASNFYESQTVSIVSPLISINLYRISNRLSLYQLNELKEPYRPN